MYKKIAAVVLSVFFAVSTSFAVSADMPIGVKQGNWIEYQVTFTGTPPEGHAVTWARMEIDSIQESNISLAIKAKLTDGTWRNETVQLNLELGQLGDDFIIPANLGIGDAFFDKWQGNITINEVGEKTYAGAKRTFVSGATLQSKYYWDRATGVLVEGNSSYADFSMYTKVEATNLWQPQTGEVDSTIVYTIAIGVGAVMAAIIVLFVLNRKKRTASRLLP